MTTSKVMIEKKNLFVDPGLVPLAGKADKVATASIGGARPIFSDSTVLCPPVFLSQVLAMTCQAAVGNDEVPPVQDRLQWMCRIATVI